MKMEVEPEHYDMNDDDEDDYDDDINRILYSWNYDINLKTSHWNMSLHSPMVNDTFLPGRSKL